MNYLRSMPNLYYTLLILSLFTPLLLIWDGQSKGELVRGVYMFLVCIATLTITFFITTQFTGLILMGVPAVVVFMIALLGKNRHRQQRKDGMLDESE